MLIGLIEMRQNIFTVDESTLKYDKTYLLSMSLH